MVNFNYTSREVTVKVVYYGPGLCGKTTSLQYIYKHIPRNKKGKMVSLATQTDRTLFFDFLPIELGKLKGLNTKIQLYTVPGQVFYDATRKLVLKGADAVVFVADSQKDMKQANKDSFKNLKDNLRSLGHDLEELPHVLQFNKRDLANIQDVDDMDKDLNEFKAPWYETSAITGDGVLETLREVVRLVLVAISNKYDVEIEELVAEEQLAKMGAPQPDEDDEGVSSVDEVSEVENGDVLGVEDSVELSDLPYPDSFSADLEELGDEDLSNSYEVQLVDESMSEDEVEELDAAAEVAEEGDPVQPDTIEAFPGTPIRIDPYHYSLPITIEIPGNMDIRALRFTLDINFRKKL